MQNSIPIATVLKNLGASLAAYRLSRNMRQNDVASKAGVSRGVVARLEAGQGGTIDSLIRVLKALGLEDRIAMLFPYVKLSPLNLYGHREPRRRARPSPVASEDMAPWTWDE